MSEQAGNIAVGVASGFDTHLGGSQPLAFIVASITGVAWFNSLELVLLLFVTFTQYKGPYFWSLLGSSAAIIPYMLGFLMYFFQLTSNNYISMAFVTVGWYPMVTGQSLVLWSRLHLVSRNQRLLNQIKWMVIIDAFLFHIPTTVLTFLALGPSEGGPERVRYGYGVMEKIQMTAFCIQEFLISTVYLCETVRMLKTSFHERRRKVMWQLIFVNCFIILIDVALLGVEYASLYTLETTLKGIVYSIKLRLEFAVLNQLVAFTQAPKHGYNTAARMADQPTNVLHKITTNDSSTATRTRKHRLLFTDPWAHVSSSSERRKVSIPAAEGREDSPISMPRRISVAAAEYGDSTRQSRQHSWVQDFAYRPGSDSWTLPRNDPV